MAVIPSGSKRGFPLKNKFFFVLRVALGLVFVGASLYKISSPGSFAHQIYNFKMLPVWAINPVAIVLPWLQLFCGLALVFNRWTRGASLLIVLMLLTFQVALASALMRGLNISCGCFKSGGDAATWWTFGRDSLLLLAGVIQLIKSR
ncbi:MAG: hypothetical protein KCHDKBKB_02591 [Elusimicrobia bacterium]|nr:hypothetical protein [Elusimicrobiota bacterium]